MIKVVLLFFILNTQIEAIIDVPLSSSSEKEGFGFQVNSNFNLASGNINVSQYSAGAYASYQNFFNNIEKTKSKIEVSYNRRWAKNNSRRFINNSYSAIRYRRMFTEKLGLLGFVQSESNEFRRLESREVIGLGTFIKPVDKKYLSLWIVTAPMYENEELKATFNDKGTELIRLANTISIKFTEEEKKWLIENSLYYQPYLERWADYRVMNVTKLMLPLNKTISIGLNYELSYDNEPPLGVVTTDQVFGNRLEITF